MPSRLSDHLRSSLAVIVGTIITYKMGYSDGRIMGRIEATRDLIEGINTRLRSRPE